MAERGLLNSWKKIARYMGRGVRTAQRYEQNLALPIHRPSGKEHSSVLAFTDELDEWVRHRPILDRWPASANIGWSYTVTVGVSAVRSDDKPELSLAKENVSDIAQPGLVGSAPVQPMSKFQE